MAQKSSRQLHHRERLRYHPWVPRGRCLLSGRIHRACPIDQSQWHRESAQQALLAHHRLGLMRAVFWTFLATLLASTEFGYHSITSRELMIRRGLYFVSP